MSNRFDDLRAALARGESGAEEKLHNLAQETYLQSGSEISLPYYELVLIAAEQAMRRGQLTRAGSLTRRAILLTSHLGSDPLDAKGYLAKITEWPARPTHLSSERIVVAVDTNCCLWGWKPDRISYEPSAPRPYRWYMLAPVSWRAQLTVKVPQMLEIIFARCAARLAAREPNDANFIGVSATNIQDMSRDQVLSEQWQVKGTAWSDERSFVVEDNGFYFPSGPNDFVPMAHLALVVAGLLDNATSIANQAHIGFKGAILERQENPQKELADALGFYVR